MRVIFTPERGGGGWVMGAVDLTNLLQVPSFFDGSNNPHYCILNQPSSDHYGAANDTTVGIARNR